MRLRLPLLLAALAAAVLLLAAPARADSSLEAVEAELALLEAQAASTPAASASSALASAKAYAAQTVQAAVKEASQADKPDQPPAAAPVTAGAAGAAPAAGGAAGPAGPAGAGMAAAPVAAAAAPAAPAGPAAAQPPQTGMGGANVAPVAVGGGAGAPDAAPAAPAAPSSSASRLSAADRAAQREKDREERQAADSAADAAERLRQQTLAMPPFRPQGLKRDQRGVYGGVTLGLAKADSLPTAAPAGGADSRTHMNQYDPHARKKDIYGRPKPCLKDIAAHFDESDIYESKRLALQAALEGARSRKHVEQLRRKLMNLETWHAMMQKKFLMSAEQEKQHEKRMERLFDAHLPAELKKQLEANKVAKRAAQPEPHPDAMARAKKILRMKRTQLAKDARLQSMGRKRIVRPEINDPEFPSMDPISSHLRERLWRRVDTDDQWSTDAADAEIGSNLVNDAHKLHEDFVDGPIAAPLLKGQLHNPDTEILGRPHFLQHFPWPKEDTDKITMDDKVKVEQMYHQTW